MSSVQCLREFINERLTAAAEEIFAVFERTIFDYQEEIDRLRRLLDNAGKPEIELHSKELPQQHVCREDEILADQQICDQERNSSLDQKDPELQIKEEQEEFCTSLEGEQLVLKQEMETFMWTPCEESYNSDDQTLDFSPDESHNSHVAECQDHKGGKHEDSELTGNAETKPKKRLNKSKTHTNNKDNSTTLKIHSTYTGEKCLKCDTCGKAFTCVSNLHAHLRVHTGEKPYPCNICEKRFSRLGALKLHMRVHSGEKPFNCKTCGKGFRRTADLKKHVRIHTGEKPYACNTCEKRFSHLGALKAHKRIHTGEKPYPCNTCEKRFSELGTLKVHMRVHTGEKPYPCNTCEKRFSELGTLKAHMRIHTGEKPYNCKTCGKDFNRRYNMKIHMRTHTGGTDSVRCLT